MERPIIFSTPMVRAILDGRKTQTRRVFKHNITQIEIESIGYSTFTPEGFISMRGKRKIDAEGYAEWFVKCPYGMPGDRLWVRETFARVCYDPSGTCDGWGCKHCKFQYKADTPTSKFPGEWPNDWPSKDVPCRWRPSIHMPREASRICLEVKSVRVERVRDISDKDAIAEGVEWYGKNFHENPVFKDYSLQTVDGFGWCTPQRSFRSLWERINGTTSWTENPWVWVIEFAVVSPETPPASPSHIAQGPTG